MPSAPEPRAAPAEVHADADHTLVRRALGGDARAHAALAARLERLPAFLRWLARRYGCALAAEDEADVLHDVLAAVWAKLEAYSGSVPFDRWVRGFASKQILKRIAKRGRALDQLGDGDAQVAAPPAADRDLAGVHGAILSLGEPASTVVHQHHILGLSFSAIGRTLGMPASSVKSIYYRNLERLRFLLAPYWKSETSR